jgi:hypothetical protein
MRGVAKIPHSSEKGRRRTRLPVPSRSQPQLKNFSWCWRAAAPLSTTSVFRRAGRFYCSEPDIAESAPNVLQLTAHCQMSIVGPTFSRQEQGDFIDRVHEGNPNIFLLCVRFALTRRQ